MFNCVCILQEKIAFNPCSSQVQSVFEPSHVYGTLGIPDMLCLMTKMEAASLSHATNNSHIISVVLYVQLN